jgi:hypothetical protein
MKEHKVRFGQAKHLRPIAALLLVAATSTGVLAHGSNKKKDPIVLDSSGGFVIGGKIIDVATGEAPTGNRSLSCDHGYVEYFLPAKPRETSIVLWHSSSAQVWQNRWDGGEGFKDKMLRADYPTYIWDGPRVGRANWSCESITYNPGNRDQGNFSAWKLGPAPPAGLLPTQDEFYPNVKFPTENTEAWLNATRSRYDEFDRGDNVGLQTDVAAVAADSGRLGDQIVYLTNSAGGLRAMMTTSKTTGDNIAGIVTYESIGYVFPLTTSGAAAGLPMPATLCDTSGAACAFGPIGIPEEDFKKLAKLKKIQFVWGDNRPEDYSFVIQSRQCAALINAYGGNAEVVKLGDIPGFEGSTHIPFADMHNDKIAGLLFKTLRSVRLDRYARSGGWWGHGGWGFGGWGHARHGHGHGHNNGHGFGHW